MRRNSGSRCLFGMIILAVTTALTAVAQTPAPTPLPEKDFFKHILEDQKTIWTAPFHIRRGDTKWVLPGSIGLMALFTTDRITGDEIAEFQDQVGTSRAVSYAGSVYGVGAAAGAFYLIGRKKDDARARETGVLIAEATIDSIIVFETLKGVTQRARPMTGSERSEFFEGGNSFPSGHATQAWTAATIIASEYHDHRSVQIAAFATATAVSLARLGQHKHYLSDVVVGSALGYAIGKYVYHKRHDKLLDSSDDDGPVTKLWHPAITPEIDRRTRQYGIGLTWSF